jgi:hypothetical protein
MTNKTNETTSTVTTQSNISISSSSKRYPADWEEQTQQIIAGMRQHQIDLGGERNPDGFDARLKTIDQFNKDITRLETELTSLRDKRNQERIELWNLASSARRATAGLYGLDSLEYQSVGGKRASERKRPTRKPKDKS